MKFIALKIELVGSGISRTIAVPAGLSLTGLNGAIQCVMDWDGCHLWEFSDGAAVRYGEVRGGGDDWVNEAPCISADEISVAHAFPKRGAHLLYTYDFGDDWRHKVTRMADPKVEEIACLKTRGTYGIDDIGGVWGLQCHVRGLEKELQNGEKGESEDDGDWDDWGHDTPESKRKFLEGPSVEELTERLRGRLANESLLPESESEGADIPVDEQAEMLGAVFNLTVDAYTWKILEQAMADGGKTIFEDQDGDIKNFLMARFKGLKIKRAKGGVYGDYEITVPLEWVEMYRVHGESWREIHGILDALESYACSAAFLYGVVSLDELTEIIKRYDPSYHLPDVELENLLDQRSRCPNMPFRMVDRQIVANCIIPDEGNDREQILDFRMGLKKQSFARWCPKDREELFQWDLGPCYERAEECAEGPEAKFLDLFEDEFVEDSFYGGDSALDCVQESFYHGGNTAEAIRSLKRHEIADIRSTSRSVEAEAVKLIQAIGSRVRVPLLKGHTRAEVGLTSDETLSACMANKKKKAQLPDPVNGQFGGSRDPMFGGSCDPMFDFDPLEPVRREEPKIGRNDPCPCGSGKKYKKCCGK